MDQIADAVLQLKGINTALMHIGKRLDETVNQDRLWDAEDIATFCSRSVSWVYKQMENEDFPLDCDNTPHRYRPEDIREYFSKVTL